MLVDATDLTISVTC